VAKQPQPEAKKRKRGIFGRVLRICLSWLVVLSLIIVGLSLLYRFVPPSYSALMLWRMAGDTQTDYRWRPLSRISKNLAYAVIASEDARFCQHNGVDWREVEDVWQKFKKNIKRRPRGASTIPMQVARNLFLWPSRNYLRKALEIPIALLIDALWSKRRMMEIYLNIIEWGPGTYGAQAASRRYFQRSANRLTRTQAALLAAALPNPLGRNAARPSSKHKRLGLAVQRRLRTIKARAACISPNYGR
jgi:monofunctional glycosyltransferase